MTAHPRSETVPSVWRLGPVQPGAAARLQQILRVSGLIAGILARRGFVDPQRAQSFLGRDYDPSDPMDLTGMADAVRVITRARHAGKKVAVYGDYDADGVIATAVLRQALQRFGCGHGGRRVPFYIPRRGDGYGLNDAAVERLAHSGVDLLVTVDCGTTGVEQVDLAHRKGMQVIVTDHHPPAGSAESGSSTGLHSRPRLPEADAIVNPWLSGGDGDFNPFRLQCGAGVALKLAQALLGEVDETWLDLVAVAAVADVVPLADENRGLVSRQLGRLQRTGNPGLRALIEVSGLAGRELSVRDLGFALGPRINALGRVEKKHAAGAVTAFNTASPDLAMNLARRMDQANRRRQEAEELVLSQVLAPVYAGPGGLPPALVFAGPDWSPGVIGIVAARLVREYGRPVAVVSLDGSICRGSARSVPGINLREALGGCAHLLERFGGHATAAGFAVRPDHLEAFSEQFASVVGQTGLPEPVLELDGLIRLRDVTDSVVADLRALSPYGEGNPEPLLCVPDVGIERAYPVGDGTHLKMTVDQDGCRCQAIAFGLAGALSPLCSPGSRVDLACTPVVNEFRGRRSVELQVRAARPANCWDEGEVKQQ